MIPIKKEAAPEQSRRPGETSPLRVLYVEDDAENRLVAQLNLSDRCDLSFAATDIQACEAIRKNAGALDAILMDIELKGSVLDGMKLTQLLRGSLNPLLLPPYARGMPVLDIPIFYITAFGDTFSMEELERTGANWLVAKPVDFTQLMLALTQCHLRKLRAKFSRL